MNRTSYIFHLGTMVTILALLSGCNDGHEMQPELTTVAVSKLRAICSRTRIPASAAFVAGQMIESDVLSLRQSDLVDAWGTALRITFIGGNCLEFRSAGSDKTMMTSDDVVLFADMQNEDTGVRLLSSTRLTR